MSDFLELSKRCRSLIKPDRELDADLGRATGWIHKCDTQRWGIGAPHWSKDGRSQAEIIGYWHGGTYAGSLPYFTASMDAAVTLVPEGFMWMALTDYELAGRAHVSNALDKPGKADAFSPAAAIAAAAMQAWHLKETHEDLSDLLTYSIKPNDFNKDATDSIKEILASLDVPWWKEDQYRQALASAYLLGKKAS